MDPRDPNTQPTPLADGQEWKDAITRTHLSVADAVEQDQSDPTTPADFEVEYEPLVID